METVIISKSTFNIALNKKFQENSKEYNKIA